MGWADPLGEGAWAVVGGITGAVVGGLLGGPGGAVAGAAVGAYAGARLGDGESDQEAGREGQAAGYTAGVGEAAMPLLEDLICSAPLQSEGTTCFAAGTKVVMADGSTKAVEEVRAGDRVESRSDKSDERGRVEVAKVERAFELHTPGTLLLRFEGEATVEATAVHPFYVVGKGFTPAGDLKVGDRIAEDHKGKTALLVSVVRLGSPKPVFNLTISGTHTYFVRAGGDDLWVHNAPCRAPYYDFTDDAVADVQIAPSGSRRTDAARANRASGYKETPDGHDWHHHVDYGRMQLVPRTIHQKIPHRGGFSIWGQGQIWW